MKVSAEQKIIIRRKLLETAAQMIAEQGFAAVTMRDISTGAGYSPSTIYSYFSSKEKIFFAWFEDKQQQMLSELENIDDFDQFTIKEKLQTILEIQLDIWQSDLPFVEVTFKALMDSPLRSFSELRPVQRIFSDRIENIFETATVSGEIPEQSFKRFLCHLFWDYRNLVALYWLKDSSEGKMNTSRLIDMSLDIFLDVVRTGMISKVADIAVFLIRSHFFGNIDKLLEISQLLGNVTFPSTQSEQTNGE